MSPAAPAYPPAPWELHGQAQFHVLAIPAARLPPTPDGFSPLVLAGHGLVVAGFVDYQSGSVLRYGELLAAVVGFGRGLTATVTHMWVDSPASRAGGRELWGYPKELACFALAFDPSGSARAATPDGSALAAASFRALATAPWRVSVRGGTVQPGPGGLGRVRALMRGRPSLGRGSFEVAPDGPLAFLGGGRTLLRIGMGDFHFTFGI